MTDILSPLFLQPFLIGLCFALVLPLFGCYLRLREEWLAAFAYAHVAAAGALCAMALEAPLVLGGVGMAALAALAKRLTASRLAGGTAYALLLLIGWAAAVLLTANLPMAERLGHALFDGQLYFADAAQLAIAVICLLVALPLLALLSRHLLLAQLYPAFFGALRLPAWRVHLGFDLLAVGILAVATMSLGVMGAFALVFVPPWAVFARAPSWRRGLVFAAILGVGGYVLAFFLALHLDQPFGPVLAVVLVALGIVALPNRRHCA
ncbi:MAG: ABC-type Mn2+/Zn2+ transport system permease component-like protein [Rhodocyclaceae bacterium]|nr:ABC-type Mn2+/Zn2+ transport system permease component-like protein [Rhodocyclaceae bacterium]